MQNRGESQSGKPIHGIQRIQRIQPKPASGAPGQELVIPNPKLRLMEQVREVLRVKHYSIRTERCYCDWIGRYVRFHRMRSRDELFPGGGKVEEFLSDLAVNGQVAASTQNQAFNALLFLYGQVLHQPLENVQAVRADRPARLPTVLTAEEVKSVIGTMSGPPQLVVKLLYGKAAIRSGIALLPPLFSEGRTFALSRNSLGIRMFLRR